MRKTLFGLVVLSSVLPVFASIDTNLKYGHRGDDVYELQDFLFDKGFLSSSSTGYFGILTLKAVKAYQSSVSVPATGFVGVMTREKINQEINKLVEESPSGGGSAQKDTSRSSLEEKVSELAKQLEEQKRLQEQTNLYAAQIAKNTSPKTKQCVSGEIVPTNDNCIKICPNGEKVLDHLVCGETRTNRTESTQPWTYFLSNKNNDYGLGDVIGREQNGDVYIEFFPGMLKEGTVFYLDVDSRRYNLTYPVPGKQKFVIPQSDLDLSTDRCSYKSFTISFIIDNSSEITKGNKIGNFCFKKI